MTIPKGKPWPKVLMRPGQAVDREQSETRNVLRLTTSALKGLDILREHYGIETSPDGSHWALLCLALARDAFPYFRPDAPRLGRPKRWTRQTRLQLWFFVEMERAVRHRTLYGACESLCRQMYRRDQPDALLARYKEGKKIARGAPDDEFVRGARAEIQNAEKLVQKRLS